MIIRALPRTRFDFSSLPASGTCEFVVATGLDVSGFREGNLILRLHALTVTGGGGGWFLFVNVRADAPTDEDPVTDFKDVATTDLASLPVASSAPYLVNPGDFGKATFTTPFGGAVKLKS